MTESSPVLDWDAIFQKAVRAREGEDIGVVVGVSNENIFVQKAPMKEIILSKKSVGSFDGDEVVLNITGEEARKHEIRI